MSAAPIRSFSLPMKEGACLGYIDIDATSITLGAPFKDRPDVQTSVVNEALFACLQQIYQEASRQGVTMAFAFTTNRAQEQTFNDLLFKYAALRDSGISRYPATSAVRCATITYLFEYVKSLKLPFYVVADIFDGFGQGVKAESIPVGSFFEDVLKRIEADFIAHAELYYQQLREFKAAQGLVAGRHESEDTFEARVLAAIYAYRGPTKPGGLIAKMQSLHENHTRDHEVASSKGVKTKAHIFKQVEPFLLERLAVARGVKPTYFWVDDFYGAIIGALQEMILEQKARLLFLHIDHDLGDDHSRDLLLQLTKQVDARTGKSKSPFFTAAWLQALVPFHFPALAADCCFRSGPIVAADMAMAKVPILGPGSPPPVDTGPGRVFEEGAIAEVMTPTPSPHRKAETVAAAALKHPPEAAAAGSGPGLAARRGVALEPLGTEAKTPPAGSATPETVVPTPVTQVGTPADSGSTLSVAMGLAGERTPGKADDDFRFTSLAHALSGPGMAVRPSLPPTAAGKPSLATLPPHLRERSSHAPPPAPPSYAQLARSRVSSFSHLGSVGPAGVTTVNNPYVVATALSSAGPKAPLRRPPPPPVPSPPSPPSGSRSAVAAYLQTPPSATPKTAAVPGAAPAISPAATAYLQSLRRSQADTAPHLRGARTGGPAPGGKY